MTLNEDKIRTIIRALRKKIRLLLAGFDVVIDNITGSHAVIDINVYPGYDSFPNFFKHFLDSIDEVVSHKTDKVYANGEHNGIHDDNCGYKMNGLINVGLDPVKYGVTGMNID